MSGNQRTVFCTPAFGRFGSVIDLGVDLAPVRDRIQACKLRYHKELWNIICDWGIQENGGGDEDQPDEEAGGEEEGNQSNTSKYWNSASASNSGAGRFPKRKGGGGKKMNKPQPSSQTSAIPLSTALLSDQSQLLQQGQPYLQNQNDQWTQQQQLQQYQPQFNQQHSIPETISPSFPQSMQPQKLPYLEQQMKPQWLPYLKHLKQQRHVQHLQKPHRYPQLMQQQYLEKQGRQQHFQFQQHPPLEQQRSLQPLQQPYLKQAAYPQQQFIPEMPLEVETQQSHPVNPRLAYLDRPKAFLLDCNFTGTSSSSCLSPCSTAADESQKVESTAVPSRHHPDSHAFVPIKCGDWMNAGAAVAKKKRHKHSTMDR